MNIDGAPLDRSKFSRGDKPLLIGGGAESRFTTDKWSQVHVAG